jgi:hypothetical protein
VEGQVTKDSCFTLWLHPLNKEERHVWSMVQRHIYFLFSQKILILLNIKYKKQAIFYKIFFGSSRIGIFYTTLDLNHNRQTKKCETYSKDLNYYNIVYFLYGSNKVIMTKPLILVYIKSISYFHS